MVVNERLVDARLPRLRRSQVALISAKGETLSVDIHAYKYPGVIASFSQRRIESESWEEGWW